MTEIPCLIDTNVLVYAAAPARAPQAKVDLARRLLAAAFASGTGHLSTQVLIECFDVLTRLAGPDDRDRVAATVRRLAGIAPVFPTGSDTVMLAVACARRHGLRIFDAMMWASAAEHAIPVVLTEDIGHRRTIEGVTFLDPFAEDFRPSEIGLAF